MNYEAEYKKITKAKIQLMAKDLPFLSNLVMSLNHIVTPDIPTARVNGTTVFYNPNFLNNLNQNETVFLVAHEAMHLVLEHIDRIQERDPKKWNEAGDHCINGMLIEMGLEMPSMGLYDPDFAGWSTNKIYDFLVLHDISSPNVLDGDIGDLPDSLKSDEDKQVCSQQIKQIVAQCVQAQKSDPNNTPLPVLLSKIVESTLYPKVNWNTLLDEFMDSVAADDYSWRRVNMKYLPEFYVPSLYSETLEHLTIAIDTSGSITEEMKKAILSKVKDIYTLYQPANMVVLDCDFQIVAEYAIKCSNDLDKLEFAGGRGTSFIPVMEYCKKNDTNVLLYFTDLEGESRLSPEYNFPIVWICYSDMPPMNIGKTIYCNENLE